MFAVRRLSVLLFAVLVAGAAGLARADDYPSRPVRLIVGFGPGTGADVTARVLGTRMSQTLGQQIVVENRPGGGSSVAAEYVVRAPRDGYTLFMGTAANVINGAIKMVVSRSLGSAMARVAMMPGTAQAKLDSSGIKLRPDRPTLAIIRSIRKAARAI